MVHLQYSGSHNTVVHLQYNGSHTIQWFTFNIVVYIKFSGSHTIQWFTYNTVVHLQYNCLHTIQWLVLNLKHFVAVYQYNKMSFHDLKDLANFFICTSSAWGVFADQTSKFSVNLRKDNDDFMIHVDFRPPPNENKVVLNSLAGHWQTEIRTEMPKFTNGQVA